MDLRVDPHPLLEAAILRTTWAGPLGEIPGFVDLAQRFLPEAETPVVRCEQTKARVRDLLRHGGFKPTGRSKPASEYLLKALEGGFLGPINAAVDVCNVASLHSGLPISVVDLDRLEGPLRLGQVAEGLRYVFNPSGQEISLGGLICLHDAQGPCGGPVKDSQRTKTHEDTTRTLSVVWGTRALPGRTEATARWMGAMIEALGGQVELSLPAAPADLPG